MKAELKDPVRVLLIGNRKRCQQLGKHDGQGRMGRCRRTALWLHADRFYCDTCIEQHQPLRTEATCAAYLSESAAEEDGAAFIAGDFGDRWEEP